jgi:hypothetical protein
MQGRIVLSLALTLGSAIAFGCSGASTSDLVATSSATQGTGNGSDSGTGTGTGSGKGDGGSGTGSGTDGGTGTGSGTDSGMTVGDNPYGCSAGDMEVEPNDTFQTATPMTGTTFCGRISTAGGNGNPGDTDFATFVLSPTAQQVTVNYKATDKVQIFVTTKGQQIEITQSNPKPLPNNPGSKYTIQVLGVNGSTPVYRIDVVE